jgi:hypothetical protein
MILKPTKQMVVQICRRTEPQHSKRWGYLGYAKIWFKFFRHKKTNKLITQKRFSFHLFK